MAKRIRTKPFEKPETLQKVRRSIETLIGRYIEENGSWDGDLSSASIKALASNSIGRLEPRKFNEQFFRGIGAGALWDWFAGHVASYGEQSERETFQWLEAGSLTVLVGNPQDSRMVVSAASAHSLVGKTPQRKRKWENVSVGVQKN